MPRKKPLPTIYDVPAKIACPKCQEAMKGPHKGAFRAHEPLVCSNCGHYWIPQQSDVDASQSRRSEYIRDTIEFTENLKKR